MLTYAYMLRFLIPLFLDLEQNDRFLNRHMGSNNLDLVFKPQSIFLEYIKVIIP